MSYGDGQTQGYTFDAMGNRLSRQDSASGATNYAYNAANMLTGSTGANASIYAPDADGDTLSGGERTCAWDSQNRLASCALSGPTTTFTYGADGLRRSMTSPTGVTTDYVYDGQSMIREMQRNGSGVLVPTATYLTGPRGPEYRRDDTQQQTDGQGHTYAGKASWYVYDGLGSVVGEVDPLGNLTCSDEYDVYGAVRGRTGTATTAHGFVGALGHLSDASTGLIYMRARYYDPQTGRFQSEDSAKSGSNWFIYCNASPTNYVDASGKDGEMIGELGVMDIGTSLNATDAMGAVAAAEFGDLTLTGEATYMASSGAGTTVDTILETYGADAEEIAKGSWEYYKSSVAEMPGTVMKAWLRWNGEEFDAYLKCEQDIDGDAGFASHDSPYVGADSDPDW